MTTYYKAVRPDGASFHDPEFRWLPSDDVTPEGGWLVEHPDPDLTGYASGYLSVATVATDCTGMEWPCRLLAVEPVDGFPVVTPDSTYLPHKRAAAAWRVVAELPATDALGPQGVQVAALIERVGALTVDEQDRLAAARDAAWDYAATNAARAAAWDYAARGAARDAAWCAARDAARDAAWCAARARDAAWGVLARDLITPEQYDLLVAPWESAMGTQWTRDN